MDFSSLGLDQSLLEAIADQGYTTPTPIQAQAIPAVLEGRDLLAAAQTGTGKTAAFTLPLLQRLIDQGAHQKSLPPGRSPRILILVPTRELAAQVSESVANYGKKTPLRQAVIFGGVGMQPQINALRSGVDFLIATPGRLLDLVAQGHAKLNRIEVLVLDEADRMLDMGFIRDIKKIVTMVPKVRQNLLFSATFSKEIRELASGLLYKPQSIEVAARNATADRLCLQLERDGFLVGVIHGNKSQSARTKALNDFKEERIQVLVATDIAARGLDIPELPHVVNYELPDVPADYVHRIGRTGRAGAGGVAISLVSREEAVQLRDIERLLGRKLPLHPMPEDIKPLARTQEPAPPQRPTARRDAPGSRREPQRNHRQPAHGERRGAVRTS